MRRNAGERDSALVPLLALLIQIKCRCGEKPIAFVVIVLYPIISGRKN